MRNLCTILHLSDIHFGDGHVFYQRPINEASESSTPSLLYSLSKKLEELANGDEPIVPDIVVCTGDFCCAWEKPADLRVAHFKYAVDLFKGIHKKINEFRDIKLDIDNFLIIPGNHDVLRSSPWELRTVEFWQNVIWGFYGNRTTDITGDADASQDRAPNEMSVIVSNPQNTIAIVGVDSTLLQDEASKKYWEKMLTTHREAHKEKYKKSVPDGFEFDYWPGFVNPIHLDKVLKKAKVKYPGATLAVAMHHPLLGRFHNVHDFDYRPILNSASVLDVLASHNVMFTLHGHKHINDLYSIHYRGSSAKKGWHLAAIQAGSMCKPDHWSQPDMVNPSFNIVRLRVPVSDSVLHIESRIYEVNSDKLFQDASNSPFALRIETKELYEYRIEHEPDADTIRNQPDWKLFIEMPFIQQFGAIELLTKADLGSYVKELKTAANKTTSFIWMTCCVTPEYLLKQSSATIDALNAFVAAAKRSVDVRRIMILRRSDYLDVTSDKSSLVWFWTNAGGDGLITLHCTQREWLKAIAGEEIQFPHIDFVMFDGNGKNIEQQISNGHVVAYLAGGFKGDFDDFGHIIRTGSNVKRKGLVAIASFFHLDYLDSATREKIERCLIPCRKNQDFYKYFTNVLTGSSPPSVQQSLLYRTASK